MRRWRLAVLVCLVLGACAGGEDEDASRPTAADGTSASTTSAPEVPPTSTAPPERPTLEGSTIDDPGVVIDLPASFGGTTQATARLGPHPRGSGKGGTATVKQPTGWTQFDNGDGSWELWGDDGSWLTCDATSCYLYDPYTGHGTYWDDDGNVNTIDIDSDSPEGSGVKIPPPVHLPTTPPAKPGGSGAGEPHYVTADGQWVSNQAAGEFVARTGDPGHGVQVRQEPWGDSGSVSVITAVAAEVGEHRVGVYLEPEMVVRIDGEEVVPDGSFTQVDLEDGGAVGVWSEERSVERPLNGESLTLLPGVAIVWPDLGVVRVTQHTAASNWLDLDTEWTTGGDGVAGLLGPLVGRDGTPLDDPDDAEQVVPFVDSWRVTDDESLFDYADGESTATFTDLDFPRGTLIDTPHPDAELTCQEAGVEEPDALERCVFDLAATGEEAFVASHAAIVKQLAARVAIGDRNDLFVTVFGAGIEQTDEDRASAEAVTLDTTTEVVLGPGERRTLVVDVPAVDAVDMLNEDLSCTDALSDETGGYQVFGENGTPTSDALAPCAEPTSEPFPAPGRYYVTLVGPAEGAAVTLHLRFRDLT